MSALAPASSPSPVQMDSTSPPKESYDMAGADGVSAVGRGYGNRSGDLANDEGVHKSATTPWLNSAAKQPNLKELEGDEQTSDLGGGFTRYSSSKSGTASGGTFKPGYKYDDKRGTHTVSGLDAYAVWGGERKEGVRGEWTTGDTDYGNATAKVNANAVASGGADARASLNSRGANISANLGGKVGVEASAGADYTTPGLGIDGVEKDVTAGVGVGASGFAGAKAGVGGKAGWDSVKQRFQLSGGAGAFIGAEGKADIHGHVGPIGGKLEAGGFVGAGLGIDGGIVYEGGKLTIGGRAWAGLGYGGKVGGSVTIDLKQAAQMGIAGAKAAYNLADADQDGKLTLNDPATRIAQGMKLGARGVEKGVDNIIFGMDADGDGKFTSRDVGLRYNQAKTAVSDTATAVKDKAVDMGHQAVEGVRSVGRAGYELLDQSGDNHLGVDDLKIGADKIVTAGKATVSRTIQGAQQAKDAAVVWTGQKLQEGRQALDSALASAKSTADRDGDGQLGLNDVRTGASELAEGARNVGVAAMDTGKRAYNKGSDMVGQAVRTGRDMAHQAQETVVRNLDMTGDGKLGIADAKAAVSKGAHAVEETARAMRDKATQLAHDAHASLDRDGDGSVSLADAVQAKDEVKRAVTQRVQSAVRQGKAAVETVREKAYETAVTVKNTAVEFQQTAHRTMDRTGDGSLGLDDVRLGAQQAKAATVRTVKHVSSAVSTAATNTYNAAAEQINTAGATISEGYDSAKETASAAVDKLTGFFGW
jgi:hypothetical protein